MHPTRGRYAPSPTGAQHLGNLRTALLAWVQARWQGGALIVRMEDLDTARVVEGSAQSILEELAWLGLDWEEGPGCGGPFGPYVQSERLPHYEQAMERLRALGKVYPCYCSRKDIREAASAPHHGSPVYPGTCRGLSPAQQQAMRARKGRAPAWRYNVSGEQEVAFVDRIQGEVRVELAREVGDFVVQRRDGVFAYQLAVVVDDGLMEVSDVVRGEDLLGSTPMQVALYGALGFEPPQFWHVPLLRDEQGERLSKRDGTGSLAQWRGEHAGASAEAVLGMLAATMGWVERGRELSAQALWRVLGESGQSLEELLGRRD